MSKSGTFVGHALWLVPSGESLDAYTKIIQDMAKELGTLEYVPHLTLVAGNGPGTPEGEKDVLEKTRKLASQLAPYTFELDELGYQDAYFQCAYAKMKKTPEAMAANELARQIFTDRQSDPPYMPHLSLVYGNLTEEQKKTQVIPKLEERIKAMGQKAATLQIDSVQVWNCTGTIEDWYLADTVPLTGTKK